MPGTILVVEDEVYLAILLQDILQSAGYEVVLSPPSRAVDSALEIRPLAVVMDYLLPGVSGREVVEHMRRRLGDDLPPVILVTGLSNVQELAAEMGVDAYLRKPFDVDTFVQTVGRLTAHRG